MSTLKSSAIRPLGLVPKLPIGSKPLHGVRRYGAATKLGPAKLCHPPKLAAQKPI